MSVLLKHHKEEPQDRSFAWKLFFTLLPGNVEEPRGIWLQQWPWPVQSDLKKWECKNALCSWQLCHWTISTRWNQTYCSCLTQHEYEYICLFFSFLGASPFFAIFSLKQNIYAMLLSCQCSNLSLLFLPLATLCSPIASHIDPIVPSSPTLSVTLLILNI